MRILIAEDDLTSRKFLFKFLSRFGECDLVVDGVETLDAYMIALKEKNPYQLICLDIMMPKIDGIKVLKAIKEMEKQHNLPDQYQAKIIMTTALAETEYVQKAFDIGSDAYATKPIDTHKFEKVLKNLELIGQAINEG